MHLRILGHRGSDPVMLGSAPEWHHYQLKPHDVPPRNFGGATGTLSQSSATPPLPVRFRRPSSGSGSPALLSFLQWIVGTLYDPLYHEAVLKSGDESGFVAECLSLGRQKVGIRPSSPSQPLATARSRGSVVLPHSLCRFLLRHHLFAEGNDSIP